MKGESGTAEMKLMKKTADCARLDYKKLLDTVKELNTQPIIEFIENFRCYQLVSFVSAINEQSQSMRLQFLCTTCIHF
jgi:hypothetical protein